MRLKKFLAFVIFSFVFAVSLAAEGTYSSTKFNFDGTVKMKIVSVNDSRYAWRDLLYSENPIVEGSKAEYKVIISDLQKGFVNPVLFQKNGNSIKLNTNGKEQLIKPGLSFSKEKGLVWLSFTAPDKNTYALPTGISFSEKQTDSDNALETDEKKKIYSTEELAEPDLSYDDQFFFKRKSMIPDNERSVGEYVQPSNQKINKGYNEQVVVKNLPDGTKPRIFEMDNKEVLVYIAPDLTLHNDENCFTLFYSVRRAGRDEEFSQPKRIMENPKVNGYLTNVMEFDGTVAMVSGRRRLVLVWTQGGLPVNLEYGEEDVMKSTAIFTSNWREDDAKWSTVEAVSDVCGCLQFHPTIYTGGKGVQLEITKRPDNRLKDIETDFVLPESRDYYSLEKDGKWSLSQKGDFGDYRADFPFTDINSEIPWDYNYVLEADGSVAGALWSATDNMLFPGSVNCFVKTYIKSPETKKMIWTESVPVVYHNVQHQVKYPSGVLRPNGDLLITYLSASDDGNNICVATIKREPCLSTLSMEPYSEDMQTPGKNIRFRMKLLNYGIGLTENCDMVVKNALKTEAGKITAKRVFYPGVVYTCDTVYEKLKGKDGVVPVESIKGEVKFPKTKPNSTFSNYNASFTLGIPLFTIGDVFVTTKGKVQTVTFTAGTKNGVKVKPPVSEVVVTQSVNEETNGYFDDKINTISLDYDFSDTFLEKSFSFPVNSDDVSEYLFEMKIHFRPENCRIPGIDSEILETLTSESFSFVVENPEYYKDGYSLLMGDTSFAKKTKVMSGSFIVSNNWASSYKYDININLKNKISGEIEQTITIPLELDVLQNKKIDFSFDPAVSENSADYEVEIQD
ncbi:MAG: hypothetical protein HUK25_03065 [Treponema sp.]|nr:hypothetical protein [Treponema sp.]